MKGINIQREEIIAKIYLTRSDVRILLRCGWEKANEAFDYCHKKCIDDGYVNVEGRIHYKYLLDRYHIKESDIHRMAKIEREAEMQKGTA